MNKLLISAIIFSVLITGLLLNFKKQRDDYEPEPKFQQTEIKDLKADPTDKPVSKDDSFSSIESDLNNTIILNEDFSDL